MMICMIYDMTSIGANRTYRVANIRALLSEMSTFLYSEVLSEGPDVTKNVDVEAVRDDDDEDGWMCMMRGMLMDQSFSRILLVVVLHIR